MSSRTSKSQAAQQQKQKQQGGSIYAVSATRSTASTSRMRMGSGAASNFPGSQGGVARTEPPRSMPAFSATSSIRPSESASNAPTQMSASPRTLSRAGGSRSSSIRPAPVPTHQYPPSPPAARYGPQGSFGVSEPYMMPMGGNIQPSLSSFAPSQRRGAMSSTAASTTGLPPPSRSATSQQRSARSSTAPSTARASDNYASVPPQGTSSNFVPRAMSGMPSRAPQQNYAGGWEGTPQPAGINIGASPYGPVNLHYNQVDNRQLTIHNNAPGNVTTTNNNITKVDKSNHHNTHAPQKNTHHTSLANVGNTHTTVKQKATSARTSTAKRDTAGIYRAA